MAATRIDIGTFLRLASDHPVIDVRSEGEFEHAHFPNAVSMPLFDNEERKIVGTAYKKESKQKAIKTGLELFGKKMVNMVETVEALFEAAGKKTGKAASKTVIVYCWRGGMRSGGVSWLLDLYGFKVYTLIGGYKVFRRWSLQQMEKDYPFRVIGGYTGSGKTLVLNEIKKLNLPVIDLEDLAKHKGSAFGNIGMPPQPSQEMFENLLAVKLYEAVAGCVNSCRTTVDSDEAHPSSDIFQLSTSPLPSPVISHQPAPVWIEDESQRIGLVNLPTAFYTMMRSKPIYFLDIPFEERLKHIVAGYGKCDKEELVNAALRIQKRLGGLETKTAVNYITNNNIVEAFRILLKYYDKQYAKGLFSRSNVTNLIIKLESETTDAVKNAHCIINKQPEDINA